jgi:hypothetical protein
MTEYARAGAPLPTDSNLPFGEAGCDFLDGFVTDGTVKGGDAVKITSVTDYNTLAVTGADTDTVAGILMHDPAWNVALGTAPASGLKARILTRGRCSAYVTFGSGANSLMGTSLGVTSAGALIIAADGKNPCARLYDRRGADNTTSLNIIDFHGNTINST